MRKQVGGIQNSIVYIKKYWFLYLLALPATIHMIIFSYFPMYGVIIAFKDFSFRKGVLKSPWVGLEHFKKLALNSDFLSVIRNTVSINILNLLIGFTFTIVLALLLNEIVFTRYKKVLQTVVYFPHFLSWVIFAGLITALLAPDEGVVNKIIAATGNEPVFFMTKPQYFQFIVVFASMVKETGFGTIIYLAAIASVNTALYESAIIDGANRGHLIWHITIPHIQPTIAVLLILKVAGMFSSNFEQIWTMYNPTVYETGDVISTYLYRMGLQAGKFELGTAMGLVFGIIGLVLILLTNKIIKKMNVMGIF